MRLPEINTVGRGLDYSIEFKGINHNMYVGENQFWDTYNLCATNYPVMTPRAKRAEMATLTNAGGIYARGALYWVSDRYLYKNGTKVTAVGQLSAGKKQFVGQGAYIIIFPDGKRYNTSTGAVDSLSATWTMSTGTATISIARMSGADYNNVTAGTTAPEDPDAGDYWLDTSQTPAQLKIYGTNGIWQAILTTYLRIAKSGIGGSLKVGDAVEIAGPDAVAGTHEIVAIDDDWILIPGIMDAGTMTASTLSVTRSAPAMDYVCELNNRVWGCSNATHEIFCSKLGDATNWNKLGTLAGDAWRATVGSDGDFTGCCAYGGAVLFWKENMLHKVMGSKPSNFQIMDAVIRGVQKGSEKSIRVVNEVLMYKSVDGVMVYDGSTPTNVGVALGVDRFYEAAAGVDGDRYYISMRTESGNWGMWVFNEAKGMWHREDGTHAVDFAYLDGNLYYLDSEGNVKAARGYLATQTGAPVSGAVMEEDFDWWAETGDMLMESPDYKYVTRIRIRATVEASASLTIEAMYDSSGVWEKIYGRGPGVKQSFTIPMIPRRCDHMRLKISGHGRANIYAIAKETEAGSDI